MNSAERSRLKDRLTTTRQALKTNPGSAALIAEARSLETALIGEVPAGVRLHWQEGDITGMTISTRRDAATVLDWVCAAWTGTVGTELREVHIGRCADLPAVLSALTDLPPGVESLSIDVGPRRRQEPAQSISDLSAIQDHPGISQLTIRAGRLTLAPLRLPALQQATVTLRTGSEADLRASLPDGVALTFRRQSGRTYDETEPPELP